MSDYGNLLFGAQPAPLRREEPETGFDYGQALFAPAAAPRKSAPKAKREVSFLEAAGQGFSDFATLEFADEAEAALRSKVGGEDYGAALADVRERQADSPSLPYYLGAGAALLTPGGIGTLTAKGAKAFAPKIAGLFGSKGAQYAAGAGLGAAEGAVAGAGGSEREGFERLSDVPAGAAAGAVGGAAGTAIGRGLERFANRGVARDIARLDPASVADLQAKARQQGIQLTPAELTGLPSLSAQQKMLGNVPGAGDDLADFYRTRADTQIEPAVGRFLDRVSDFELGSEAAGERIRAAANRAMSAVERARADQARPLYASAFQNAAPVNVAPVVKKIEQRLLTAKGPVKSALEKAKSYLYSGNSIDRRLTGLHDAKLAIDDLISSRGENAVGRVAKRELMQVKDGLLEAMDKASPDYQSARSVYADMSPGVERVREGVAGVISDFQDPQLRNVAAKLFDRKQIGPRAAREAKQQLQTADPQAWQAIKRSFLEDAWIRAGNETLTSQGAPVSRGAKFRKALLGDPKQLMVLQATLEPEEMRALNSLADVLEASGRVKPLGSDTAWNQELLRTEKRAAQGMLSKTISALNPNILKEISTVVDEQGFRQHTEKLVRAITDPNGIALLKELKQITPNQEMRRAILGYALGMGASRELDVEMPQPAPAEQPQPQAAAQPQTDPTEALLANPGAADPQTLQTLALAEIVKQLRAGQGAPQSAPEQPQAPAPAPEAPTLDPARLEALEAQLQELQASGAMGQQQLQALTALAGEQQQLMGGQLDALAEAQAKPEPITEGPPAAPQGGGKQVVESTVERDQDGEIVAVITRYADGTTRRRKVTRDSARRLVGVAGE